MKKSFLILSLLLISITIIVSISVVASSQTKIPDPNLGNLPDHLVWNSDLGEYYNGDDFIWNSEMQRYEPRIDNKATFENSEDDILYQDWFSLNKDSNDPIIQSIIAYHAQMDQYYQNNLTASLRSDIVTCEEAVQEIKNLGYVSLTDMYQYIENDSPFYACLMIGLEQLLGISTNVVPSLSEENRTNWIAQFESNIIHAASSNITCADDAKKYGVISVLHEEKLTSDALSADKATTASITSAIHEIKQEYNLSTEDIKAIAEFVQYIRTVHTAE